MQSIVNIKNKTKHLIIYQFFEKDIEYTENLVHFLTFGYASHNDYIILVTGDLSFELPKLNNLEVINVENRHNDYGALSSLINMRSKEIFSYDFIFFINSSVRGPFIPSYINARWEEFYTKMFVNEIGLVGSTINILTSDNIHANTYLEIFGGHLPISHVQSMSFVIKGSILERLHKDNFFLIKKDLNKVEIIALFELRLSQQILEYGYNIACLLPEYNQIDYRFFHNEINYMTRNGDPSFGFAYFGRTPHPFETIFTKTNRDVCSDSYLYRLAYSQLCNHTVHEVILNTSIVQNYINKITNSIKSSDLVLIEKLNTNQ